MTELTIQERVAAGVAWLDRRVPNWADRVDVTTLSIESDCHYVLGQVYGGYSDSPWDARWTDDDYVADKHGFNSLDNDPDNVEDYDALRVEWRRVIEARRSGVSA